MPITQATITVVPPTANFSNQNPEFFEDTFQSGQVKQIQLTDYKNTGNVPQVITFVGVSNEVNCTVSNPYFYEGEGSGQTKTLQPGEYAELRLTVAAAVLPPAANPESNTVTASFSIEVSWAAA